MEEIYAFDFQTPFGIFYCLYKDDDAHSCSYLGREDNRFQEYKGLLLKKFKGAVLFKKKRSPFIEDQVISYLSGKSKNIDLAFAFLTGTDFQKSIWLAILDIGYGKVASYKDVARMVHKPKAYRAVGNALGKNPIIMLIPCHRVIQSNGSLGYFSSGVDLKRHLLEMEAKVFS